MTLDGADEPLVSNATIWPVHTERLTLRPARATDATAVYEYRRLPEVFRWLGAAPSDQEWPAYFEKRLTKTVVIERAGRIIGDLMVSIQDGWAQLEVAAEARSVEAEIGWALDLAFGGQGYATEAVRELIRICFVELGLRRITANCFARNTPSWRLMERLGMRREVSAKAESLHRELGWLDGYGYALLADAWRAIQEAADQSARAERIDQHPL